MLHAEIRSKVTLANGSARFAICTRKYARETRLMSSWRREKLRRGISRSPLPGRLACNARVFSGKRTSTKEEREEGVRLKLILFSPMKPEWKQDYREGIDAKTGLNKSVSKLIYIVKEQPVSI